MDSAVLSFSLQAVNRPNVLCSANKGWNVTNKASINPFMLSNRQLSSQGESGPKSSNSRSNLSEIWELFVSNYPIYLP